MPIDIASYAGPFPVSGTIDDANNPTSLDDAATNPTHRLTAAKTLVFISEDQATSQKWEEITDASATLEAGNYQVAISAPLSPVLSISAGERIRVWDSSGLTASHPLQLLAPGTNLRYKNPVTGVDYSGSDPDGLVMDDPTVYNDVEIVANSDGSFSVDFDLQVGTGNTVIADIQTNDFTAQPTKFYPVDVRARASTSELVVTMPKAEKGDWFTIADQFNACTLNRTIRIQPAVGDSIDGLVPNDYALINGPGAATLKFTAISNTHWKLEATLNS